MIDDFEEFSSDYPSWEAAESVAGGYAAPNILEVTRDALRKVRDGEAVFERDSVVVDRVDYSFPLLAGLLHAALARDGRLSVLDFGGSLGSTYFQVRPLLKDLRAFSWSIVEQNHYVECGRAEFETDELRFYFDVESCIAEQNPSVLLLSGVLGYIPNSYSFLEGVLKHNFHYVILDRTAFSRDDTDHFKIHNVPKWIYEASIPVRFLSRTQVLGHLSRDYDLLFDFETVDAYPGLLPEYRGFVFRRK